MIDELQIDDPADTDRSSDGGGGTAAAAPAPDDTLKRERDELNDRLLRTAAEFDNYRKRVERERREWSDASAMDVIRDVLPALDNLERALAASRTATSKDALALRKGIELIEQKLAEALKKRGVEPLVALGADFDPNLHDAVSSEPANGHRDGEVVDELQRGYTLRGRLIRPASVKVAKA